MAGNRAPVEDDRRLQDSRVAGVGQNGRASARGSLLMIMVRCRCLRLGELPWQPCLAARVIAVLGQLPAPILGCQNPSVLVTMGRPSHGTSTLTMSICSIGFGKYLKLVRGNSFFMGVRLT